MNQPHEQIVMPKDISFVPKAGDWKCLLFGQEHGVVWYPAKGLEPNWFHRLMQRLILGFKWERISTSRA